MKKTAVKMGKKATAKAAGEHGQDAHATGKSIVALTVRDILEEQIAHKLA